MIICPFLCLIIFFFSIIFMILADNLFSFPLYASFYSHQQDILPIIITSAVLFSIQDYQYYYPSTHILLFLYFPYLSFITINIIFSFWFLISLILLIYHSQCSNPINILISKVLLLYFTVYHQHQDCCWLQKNSFQNILLSFSEKIK